MAQTLDGHTIDPGGKWHYGSAEDKRRMDRLRMWADCLIASRRSIENDNPNLFVRSKPDTHHPKPVVILNDISKKILPDRRIFSHPHPPGEFWVFQNHGKTPGKTPGLSDLVENFDNLNRSQKNRIGQWQVYTFNNVREIVKSLVQKNFKKILLEGGPSLNGLFLKEDLIDEVFFTIVPYIWAGESKDRIITTHEFLTPARFKLLSVERRKNEVFFRYKRISVPGQAGQE